MEKALKELEMMSRAVARPPYLMQGCGGTISVKTEEGLMVMGALNYHTKQGGNNSGFAVMNYKNIRTYYGMVNIRLDMDFEKINKILNRQNMVQLENYKTLQPSSEAGFHSLLGQYVIHTHSAYANILGCSENGEELIDIIFSGKDIDCVWIPCSDPGFHMNFQIKQAMDGYIDRYCKVPNVFLLENHGLIVTADDIGKVLELDMLVNQSIKEHFCINEKEIC